MWERALEAPIAGEGEFWVVLTEDSGGGLLPLTPLSLPHLTLLLPHIERGEKMSPPLQVGHWLERTERKSPAPSPGQDVRAALPLITCEQNVQKHCQETATKVQQP